MEGEEGWCRQRERGRENGERGERGCRKRDGVGIGERGDERGDRVRGKEGDKRWRREGRRMGGQTEREGILEGRGYWKGSGEE